MFKSISKTPDSPTVTTSFGPNKKKTKKASLQAIEAAIERIKADTKAAPGAALHLHQDGV